MSASSSLRILMILSRLPSPVGSGANHRSYQVVHDVQNACPSAEIIFLSLEQIQKIGIEGKQGYSWQDYRDEFIDRAKLVFHAIRLQISPYRLFEYLFQHYSGSNHSFPFNEQIYLNILEKYSPINLCIVDHTMFSEVVRINAQRSIPTWMCPQNLETFDKYALSDKRSGNIIPFFMGFNQELNALSSCTERLVISKTEAWVLEGLEIPAHFYPYFPVGDIRNSLLEIRKKRGTGYINPRLFLMVGTSSHRTTGKSFDWLLRNASQNGLPDGCEIIVAGKGTEVYREKYDGVKGLVFRGWVDAEELTELLCMAKAVLAPQLTGFGALTRIPELACAGVPLIVSEHAAQSIDLPPNIIVLPNQWSAWRETINSVYNNNHSVLPDWSAYLGWEVQQPNPLKILVGEYAKTI